MDKIKNWLTRIIFIYRDSDYMFETIDKAPPCKDFSEWKETIRYYIN